MSPPAFMQPVLGFRPGVVPPEPGQRPSLWFVFRGDRLLVLPRDDRLAVPSADELVSLGIAPERQHYLGCLDEVDCFALVLEADLDAPAAAAFEGLRALYERLEETHFAIAGRASQIAEWDRNHRFCGRCGSATERVPRERATRCPACGLLSFPRLSPAVIVLVEDPRTDRVLLAHNAGFPEGFFSTLAGFVEPGETIEETVVREIREEVGIDVGNVRYVGSQSWPFPHSLMLGFLAEYAGGELQVDGVEITEAAWFGRDSLPRLPGTMSIARKLVDTWLTREPAPGA